ERIRKQLSELEPSDAQPGWEKRVVGSGPDVATAVDRPRRTPSATTSGNLSADVEVSMPRTVPDAQPAVATVSPVVSTIRRPSWPILAGALVLGGAAAVVIIPRWYGHTSASHTGPSTPSGAPGAPGATDEQMLLRLCGSYTVSTELAPSL